MKQLFSMAAVLAAIFASTFLIIKFTGLITVDDVEAWLRAASEVNKIYVALFIVALLFADLFIAIPTLTVTILSGYFLGFAAGAVSAAVGMLLAGFIGYFICWFFGPELLARIYKDKGKLNEMHNIFSQHGFVVLLICRSMPILPELSCCLAGANRMALWKFSLAYFLSTIPYAFIAAYAGSQSSLADPKPALITAFCLSGFLWLCWAVFVGRQRISSRINNVGP